MKQTRLFLLSCLVTICTFAVIMYSSSCLKDKCRGVVCQNGGTCSGGSCSCPTGYTGAHCENSTVELQNNTHTTLYLTVNGTPTTIAAGAAVDYLGIAGTTTISATNISTYGTYGDVIVWPDFSEVFPSGGTMNIEPFNVSTVYFFLEIQNTSFETISSLYVNYGTTSQTHESVTIPADGNNYGIGYYLAYSNTEVYALSASSTWDWIPHIPYTDNAEVALIAH